MRVGITYSVEMEKVTETVAGLLQTAIKELKTEVLAPLEKASEYLEYSDVNKAALAAAELGKAKGTLKNTDTVLEDYLNIIQGYVKLVIERQQPQAPLEPNEEVQISGEDSNDEK